MVYDYRDLIFYQKSQEVVRGIDLLIKTWPQSLQVQEISRQLFWSAISVGANIVEGHGRHQGREYIHYLTISQGSANEVDHWLHIKHYTLDSKAKPCAKPQTPTPLTLIPLTLLHLIILPWRKPKHDRIQLV